MLDRFVGGAVERVSPEAPALVLRVDEERLMIGGAGNVAVNIAHLGGIATLVGVVGDDPAAAELDRLIAGLGRAIVADGLVRDADVTTTEKTRFVAGDRHLLRADREHRPLSAHHERAVISALEDQAEECDVLVVSDYSKGVVSPPVMQSAVAIARRLGVPLVVDPKRRDFHLYAGGTLVTPNVAELEFATGVECVSAEECERAAREAMRMTGAAVLLTRSEHGVSLYRPNHPVWSEGASAKVVRDVAGAGDAVLAAAALALAVGADMIDAARLANAAAGVVVGKPGTASVTSDELNLALLHGVGPGAAEGKLVTLSSAVSAREAWRSAGLTVGLTNGAFDLIHPGHVRLLSEARQRCDRLVVALNTDASVRRLKGEQRPIQTELARAEVIGALRSVDLVVLFAEDTPIDLIAALRPDVLIKGADYTVDSVVGADLVIGSGGRIELVELVPGQSSTSLIARSGARRP